MIWSLKNVKELLVESEGYRNIISYSDRFSSLLSWGPAWHVSYHPYSLFVERRVNRAQHGDIRNVSVLSNHKTYNHTALHAVFLCYSGVTCVLVEVGHESRDAARERGHLLHHVIHSGAVDRLWLV